MPNIKSAIKRVRTTETAEERNISKKNAMRTAVKRAKTAISTDAENKDELLRFAIKQVEKDLEMSDSVLNGDLFRFYKNPDFKKVNPGKYEYKSGPKGNEKK